jgi:hypothetical protein
MIMACQSAKILPGCDTWFLYLSTYLCMHEICIGVLVEHERGRVLHQVFAFGSPCPVYSTWVCQSEE